MYCRRTYWSEPTIVGICAYIKRIMMIHNRNEWGGSTVLIKSSPLKNRFPTRHFRIYGLDLGLGEISSGNGPPR